MTGKVYGDHLKEVLSIYDDFKKTIATVPAEHIPVFKKNFTQVALETQVANIRNGKFTLMVVGEAKSGKSTFINAFLNTDILPVDVVQCTSAIIEIAYAETPALTYFTADGTQTEISDESEVIDFLKSHAQIKDEYRAIPVAYLDQQIIRHAHQKMEHQFNLKGVCIDLADENVQNLPPEEYNTRIEKYVEDKIRSWRDIIVRISIKYPLPEEMKDVRIIDSPGVNAFGQVGELTEDYIEKASAVVFIKCLPGDALESKSFMQFLNSKNGGRCREALFLFLSRASDLDDTELKKMLGDAHRLYDNRIAQERILPIDSKVQLYYNKLAGKTDAEIDEILDAEAESGRTFSWIGERWGRYSRGKITHERFDELMCDMAGFKNVKLRFEEYARRAQKIALHDLVKSLSDYYKKIISELNHGCELKQTQLENSPAEYEFEIKARQRKLGELQDQLSEVTVKEEENFTGSGGVIEEKRKSVVAEIKTILFDENLDFNALEASVTMCTDSLKSYPSELAKEFIFVCNTKVYAKCTESDLGQFMSDIVIPDISQTEIDDIKKKAEKENTKEATEGVTFKETHRRLDKTAYRKTVANSIFNRLDDIAARLTADANSSLKRIAGEYRRKLMENIAEEQHLLGKTVAKKKDAETLSAEIQIFKKLISALNLSFNSTEAQRQELANGLKIN